MLASDCVGEIVENENIDENIEIKAKFKNGFPIPIKKFTKKKEKECSNDYENRKLEWTVDVTPMTEITTNDNGPRFDFRGNITSGIDCTSNGLYHNEKQEKGYLLSELKTLSSSSHSGQRAFSLGILSSIIKKVVEKEYCFPIDDLLIIARMGLDSNHETVVLNSLFCITNSLGINTKDQMDILDQLNYSFHGSRRINKVDENLGTTIKEIQLLLQNDIVMGLLMSNIITRCKYLVRTASGSMLIQIIFLLIKIANHSNSSSEDILAENGLVDILIDRMNELQDSTTVVAIIDLFRAICISSRECCKALEKHFIIRDLMKFISANDYISSSVFQLIKVCFQYGLSGWVIDSYRAIFLESLQSFIQRDLSNSQTAKSFTSFVQMLTAALQTFKTELNPGGENDAFLPFTTIILSVDHSKIIDYLSAACLNYIQIYMNYACLNANDIKHFYNSISRLQLKLKPCDLWSKFKLLDEWNTKEFLICEPCDNESLLYIQNCLQLTCWCDKASAMIQLNLLLYKKEFVDAKYLYDFLWSGSCYNAIKYLLDNRIFYPWDYKRFYAQGALTLKESWLEALNVLICDKFIFMEEQLDFGRQIAVSLLLEGLPGDDYLIPKIIHGYVFSKNWGMEKVNSQCFNYLYTRESIDFSLGLKRIDPQLSPPVLSIPLNERNYTSMPLNRDFLYTFPVSLYSKDPQNVEKGLVSQWLSVIYKIETFQMNPFPKVNPFTILFSLMHIFLLSENGSDLFLESEISQKLNQLFDLITYPIESFNTKNADLDQKFATFYNILLDQFDSNSFGDKVFSKYIIFPTCNKYPMQFKEMFWNRLFNQLRIIQLDKSDFKWNIDIFKGDFSSELKQILSRSLGLGKISNKVTPLLFEIATSEN